MVEDFWNPAKRFLGDPKFVESVSNFDRESIASKTAKLVGFIIQYWSKIRLFCFR